MPNPVSVDSQITQNGIKCVVYGQSGVGKTRLILTCPRPLVLSAEKGLLSIRGNNVMMMPEISTLAELVAAQNWCLNDKGSAAFDTVIIDSITEIAEVVLRISSSTNKDGRKAHGEATSLIVNNVFRGFRDVPRKHVVFIAKERGDEDAFTHVVQYKPDMPNTTMRTALPGYFDFVFRYINTLTPDGQRWSGLQTFGDAQCIAKDRSGKLGPYELPNLGALFAKAMQ